MFFPSTILGFLKVITGISRFHDFFIPELSQYFTTPILYQVFRMLDFLSSTNGILLLRFYLGFLFALLFLVFSTNFNTFLKKKTLIHIP